MKVNWHRHDGIQEVDILDNDRRPFLYETPVLRDSLEDYLDYNDEKEMAISLPLFYLNRKQPEYPELLAKRVCWAVKQLCERTDAKEARVPIRIGVTTDVRDVVMPYFEICNFPMEYIDWFDSRETDFPWSSKTDAMRHDNLKPYKRVLHIDINFLMGSHPTQRQSQMFSKMLEIWTIHPQLARIHLSCREGRDLFTMILLSGMIGIRLSRNLQIFAVIR